MNKIIKLLERLKLRLFINKEIERAEMMISRGYHNSALEALFEIAGKGKPLNSVKIKEKISKLQKKIVIKKIKVVLLNNILYNLVSDDYKEAIKHASRIEHFISGLKEIKIESSDLELSMLIEEFYEDYGRKKPENLPKDLTELIPFICREGLGYETSRYSRSNQLIPESVTNIQYYAGIGELEIPESLKKLL